MANILNCTQFSVLMATTETKRADEEDNTSLRADLLVPRGFDVSHAKLTICGNVAQLSQETNQTAESQATKRALIFVIDCSGSMGGGRMTNVRDAIIPFVTEICENENTMIKLVKFCHEARIIDIPNKSDDARTLLERELQASGGTDFHIASKKLVECARDVLTRFSTYQVRIFFFCVCVLRFFFFAIVIIVITIV